MDLNMKVQIKTKRGYQPLLFCQKEEAEQIVAQDRAMLDKMCWPYSSEMALVYGCSFSKEQKLFFYPIILSLEELIIFTKQFGENGLVYAEYAVGKTKEEKEKEEKRWN